MVRRHLRYQDGVFFLHGLREHSAFIRIACAVRIVTAGGVIAQVAFHNGLQGAQTNGNGTKVSAFVNLEDRVNLMAGGEDFLNLIGYDGVETAAKGVQFH